MLKQIELPYIVIPLVRNEAKLVGRVHLRKYFMRLVIEKNRCKCQEWLLHNRKSFQRLKSIDPNKVEFDLKKFSLQTNQPILHQLVCCCYPANRRG